MAWVRWCNSIIQFGIAVGWEDNRYLPDGRPHGLYVVVGYCPVPIVDFGHVARKELTIRGVRSGSRADLIAVLDLASAEEIRLPPIDLWQLDEINDALEALRLGNVEGKAVIVP